jgi:hypothetical protein
LHLRPKMLSWARASAKLSARTSQATHKATHMERMEGREAVEGRSRNTGDCQLVLSAGHCQLALSAGHCGTPNCRGTALVKKVGQSRDQISLIYGVQRARAGCATL